MGQKHGIQDRPPPMNVDEFLVWAEGREGKFELDDGTVVAMAPERLVHGRMKVSIQTALANAIRAAGLACESILDSIAVRITPTTSYVPDVLVHCGERLAGDVRETASPVVVVEVLSPSSEYRDVGIKLRGYFSVAAIRHYLIVHPEQRLVIHHARGEGDVIATRILAEGPLVLDPPGLAIRIEDLLGPAE